MLQSYSITIHNNNLMSVIEDDAFPFRDILGMRSLWTLMWTVLVIILIDDSLIVIHDKYENLNLATFDDAEHKKYEPENNIDSEFHFYNNTDSNCEYYTDGQFKKWIIHYQ